jgi:asparagine synthetase B (glutamine-hydrolysing)
MCSFLFARTKNKISNSEFEKSNFFSKFRGPDCTNLISENLKNGLYISFLHNLLDISGNGCEQPFYEGEKGNRLFVLFNGEIYNFQELAASSLSDTACLIPAFKKFGLDLAKKLDGEYSICIYDEANDSVFIFTDPFLTKPLYIGTNSDASDFAVATCASTLQRLGFLHLKMACPNATYSITFSSGTAEISIFKPAVSFDIKQFKSGYENWFEAFFAAVKKRALHGSHRPMVFLSSGYDSGGICLALNELGISYDTFSIVAGENRELLKNRIRINKKASCSHAYLFAGISSKEWKYLAQDICSNVEPFIYQHEDSPGIVRSVQDDGGAVGANFICRKARKKKMVVNLSGSGADEILSDYGYGGQKFYSHSEFGGLFPDDLNGFFPWKKFYGDTQRSYLFKEEFILGRNGIEGRYPYLDKQVVQEFLWLDSNLKNKCYKAPLAELLARSNYPFAPMEKHGFDPFIPAGFLETALGKLRFHGGALKAWFKEVF